MKQREYEAICKNLAEVCMFLSFKEELPKNAKRKLSNYVRKFNELSKIKINKRLLK